MNRQFTEKEMQMAFKHRKRVSTSLIREMQNKIRKCYLEHFLLKNVNTEFEGYLQQTPSYIVGGKIYLFNSMEANCVHQLKSELKNISFVTITLLWEFDLANVFALWTNMYIQNYLSQHYLHQQKIKDFLNSSMWLMK